MGTAKLLLPFLLALATACGGDEPSRDAASPARGLDAPAPESVPASPSAGEPLRVPDDAPTVVFLGDSISAGLHLSADEAFPAVLQRRMADAGLPFRLVNAGVSGDTTAGGRARVDWVLRNEPDLVVVELGANDGLRGIDVESVEANLRDVVDRVRAGGARVLLLGVLLPPNYGPDYTQRFAAVYPRLANELDLPYVPYFMEGVGGVPEMNLADGLHPTPEGHEKLADNVAPALRELLGELE